MPPDPWGFLAAANYRLVDPRVFEAWLYDNPALEAQIGPRDYLDLISFDFGQPHVRHELASLLQRVQNDHGRPEKEDLAAYVANEYLDGRLDLTTICRILVGFWSDGVDWVPSEFAYIHSELDDIPLPPQYPIWDADALARKLAEAEPTLRSFDEGARQAATELLKTLTARRRNER